MLPASAALASCGHLRLCKLPWMQVCFLGLQAFSTLWQSVDFVNILKPASPAGGPVFLCLGRTGAYHLGAPFHALKAVFAVEAIGRGVAAGEQRHRRRAFRVRCRRGDSPRAGALPRGRRSARRAAQAKRRRRVCGKTRRRRRWNRTNRPPWRAG